MPKRSNETPAPGCVDRALLVERNCASYAGGMQPLALFEAKKATVIWTHPDKEGVNWSFCRLRWPS